MGYSEIPIMIPPVDEWESKASKVKTLMVLDCYNERAYQSGTTHDSFLQVILPKFTALEELHWHNAYLKGDKSRLEAAIDVNRQLLSSLRVLSLPFATTSPQGLMSVCKFNNLERLDLRCSILPDMITHGYHLTNSSSSDRHDECPLSYDFLVEQIMDMPKLKSLNIGQANDACRSLMFQYALSQSVLSSLLNKYKECGKKISINTFEDTLGADSDDDAQNQMEKSEHCIDDMPPEQRHIFESMIDFYKEKSEEMGMNYQDLRMKVASGDEEATKLFQFLFREGLTKIKSKEVNVDDKINEDRLDEEENEEEYEEEEEEEEEEEDFDWSKIWDDLTIGMDPQRVLTASILKNACEGMRIDLKGLIDGVNAGNEDSEDQMHALLKHATYEKSRHQQANQGIV